MLAAWPVVAIAQGVAMGSATFNIDAQPLPAALRAFGEQAHLQLLYRYDLVANATGNAVRGKLDKREALRLLLRGTGLEAAFVTADSATLRPLVRDAAPATHPAGAGSESNASSSGANPPRQYTVGTQSELDEIIVTARRREESLSKTPIAITAVTGQELAEAGVSSVMQLQYLVPSLMVSHDNKGVNLSIRGVTTTDTSPKGEPGINLNTDGIPVNRSEEQAIGFFDLQRVEILSGPQGTLYGKSSTGGAINAITNAPGPQQEASVSVELGNDGTRRVDGVLNLPLSEALALRAAVNANYRDGFVRFIGGDDGSRPNDEDNFSGRLSVLAHFTGESSLRATVTLGHVGGVGYGNTGVALDIDERHVGEGTALAFANRFKGHLSDHYAKFNTQLDAPLGAVHLSWLSSYSHYRTDNLTPDYSYGGDGQRLWARETYDTTYQELRFTNSDQHRLQYVAGFNYFYEHVEEDGHLFGVGDPATVVPGVDPDYLNLVNFLNGTSHTTYSAYAHATYELAPRWHVTAGLRAARDDTARRGTLASGAYAGMDVDGPIPWPNRAGGICTGEQDCIGAPNNGASNSGKLTYNIGLDRQFTPQQMGYVTIATGYKAGGFNDVNPATNAASEYGPENLTAWEGGYKLRLGSGLQYTSSLYYYDYSAEQITQLAEINHDPDNEVIFTRLFPATLYGWENSLVMPLGRADVVNFSANFERAWYRRFAAGGDFGVDFTGKTLDRVPLAVVGAGFTHHWLLRDGAGLQWHAGTRYSSAYYVTDFSAAQQYQQRPFTRSDADLSYTSAHGRFTAQLFVRNIENHEQITGGAQNYRPGIRYSASGSVSEPRLWGVRATLTL
ncbi:MAG TPA: TonB-dependent receptor [Steroidobacteraceae bacterium]|nr:TonB-dependent receptor [Steroidobacteraceae bacterium]